MKNKIRIDYLEFFVSLNNLNQEELIMWIKKLSFVFLAAVTLNLGLINATLAEEKSSFEEGKHYKNVSSVNDGQNEAPKEKVTIIEFFNYGCHWCFSLEKPLHAWAKNLPAYVEFKRVPVVFDRSWEVYAKAYYLAAALKMSDKIDPLLFEAIQTKKQTFKTNADMIKFFTQQGVDEKIAQNAFDSSLEIDSELAAGKKLMKDYQITGIPGFVVNGKYKTDLTMVNGDNEKLFKLLNELAAKAKEAKKTTT